MPERGDPAIIRSQMPVIFLGFLVVFVALFVLQWPTPVGSDTQTVPLMVRMIGQAPGENSVNLARNFLDFGIFVVTLIGIGLTLVAWKRGARNTLIGLMAVALLGIAYASGMALYVGPMVSICGFTLILFGGMMAYVASTSNEREQHQDELQDSEQAQAVDIRTNDHASTHSVA